ncbi:MAG TPA: zinc ribbon domain-containing protein [Myxococcaceae bacterium]|nr:zinc ribbon domain-containing protein [Myxococcaceae bacterium]
MPIYEYECSQCHQTSDALQKVNDPPPDACPHCGAQATLSRLVSRTSFVLKGGGWYADLYSSSKSKGPDTKAPDTADSKTPAKTETATPAAPSTPSSGGKDSGSSGSSGSGPTNSAPKVAAAKA